MNTNFLNDTISAIATPIGNGGVSIVRMSGSSAFNIINHIFSSKNLEAGKIYHGWILENNEKIDEVIVLPFKAPHSYTGEDIIEIQCHGGVYITNKILDLTIKHGARYAQKGEFTKRAFLNKKMDLSQAEAVLDLIHAQTEKFAATSAKNLFGKLSFEVGKIRTEIMDLLSRIIASVDFPDDVAEPEHCFIESAILEIIKKIDYILSFSKTSNIYRQGIKIVLAGRPNVGKSSLFNALLNLDRAIVTDVAGTTRDILQETLDIDGIATTIIDTAGIREDDDINIVEEIGINYSKKYAQDADVVLFLYDLNEGFTKEDKEIYDSLQGKPLIKIATKSDLTSKTDETAVCISLKTGDNLDSLKLKIKKEVISQNLTEVEFITNKRQQLCLEEAKTALLSALIAARNFEIQDLISIDIKTALMYVSEVSGEVITDEILNNIFDNFCIGK